MSSRGNQFSDPLEDLLRQVNRMSDRDLELAMAGQLPAGQTEDRSSSLEPGAKVEGVIVDMRSGEVLVELGGKEHGVVDLSEFDEGDAPRVGDTIRATFERRDASRDLAVLSVRGVRRQVSWEELRPGMIVEAVVKGTNKGGLAVDIKGVPAFLPISQVDRTRVEDLSPYVESKLRCQVTSVDRSTRNVILSRRAVLEMEAEVRREKAFETLAEGQVLRGTIVRVTEHGAFVDVGGVEGLIPAGKVQGRAKAVKEPLREGQQVQVQIVRLDRERKRVGLDFKELEAEAWGRLVEHYSAGDVITGWISSVGETGAVLSVEDGITGFLPASTLGWLPEEPRPGAILKAVISSIDRDRRQLLLRPFHTES